MADSGSTITGVLKWERPKNRIWSVTSSWPQIKERQNQITLFYWFWNCKASTGMDWCIYSNIIYLFIYFLQSLEAISQYPSQNFSYSEHKSINVLNSGIFSIDLAQNTFNDYIFTLHEFFSHQNSLYRQANLHMLTYFYMVHVIHTAVNSKQKRGVSFVF